MAKKVLVMMGGFSSEREVSLVSGKGVVESLTKVGYEVVPFDLKNVKEFISILEKEKPDVVFNALHGNFGEDGTIQGFLDMMQIPYTHSGLRASAIGMDKDITKQVARMNDIKVALSEKITYEEFKNNGTIISLPYVVKPVSDGSSVGVFIIKNADDLKAVQYDDDETELLIEKFIDGQEITVMVLAGKAYVVTELRPTVEFYDYKAKYTDGMTQHILPAEIPEKAAQMAMRYAEKIHKALGCNSISRSDFRYNSKDGVVLLEINTNPGLTPLSLAPEQAKYVGISYEKLCQTLVEEAKCRHLPSLS